MAAFWSEFITKALFIITCWVGILAIVVYLILAIEIDGIHCEQFYAGNDENSALYCSIECRSRASIPTINTSYFSETDGDKVTYYCICCRNYTGVF